MPKIANLFIHTSNHYTGSCAEKVCWKLLYLLWLGIANTYLLITYFIKWDVQAKLCQVCVFCQTSTSIKRQHPKIYKSYKYKYASTMKECWKCSFIMSFYLDFCRFLLSFWKMDKHWLLEFAVCACKIYNRKLLLQRNGNTFISKLRKTRVISPNAVKNKG